MKSGAGEQGAKRVGNMDIDFPLLLKCPYAVTNSKRKTINEIRMKIYDLRLRS